MLQSLLRILSHCPQLSRTRDPPTSPEQSVAHDVGLSTALTTPPIREETDVRLTRARIPGPATHAAAIEYGIASPDSQAVNPAIVGWIAVAHSTAVGNQRSPQRSLAI
jgi:hypothetical protein